MKDTHGSNDEEWIGFDLDGTLAEYDEWKGVEHIGKPVASMVVVARLLNWLGKKVKILTARVAPREGDDGSKARPYIEKWCKENLGFVPEITHVKDASMMALFDDRAVAVEQNTGKILGGWLDWLPKASDKAKKAVLEREKKAEADVLLRDGTYDHVKNVFEQLSKKDREYVAPGHSEFYASAKPLSRVVAFDDSNAPVGFSDTFDEEKYIGEKGKRRASVEIAVLESARRKGIARKMAIMAIKKAIRTGRFDDIDWNVVHGNHASEELAKKLGFKRRGWHWHPKYTISKDDFLDKAEKKADAVPSNRDLRRMYDILQADAGLDGRIAGLGFGSGGDAYRRAAIKLHVMEFARLLRDGKRIRNRIVHVPGYIPSEDDANRALRQYAEANDRIAHLDKTADAHHPDFERAIKLFKDRYGIDLSHVRMKYSKHPRYNNGKRSYDFDDDETGGSHGHLGDDSVVWINPRMRPVMDRFNVTGKVKDFRRWIIAHELAHEIDSTMKKKRFVGKMVDKAKKEKFWTGYLDTVPEHKIDKEIFAEYMAHLLSKQGE